MSLVASDIVDDKPHNVILGSDLEFDPILGTVYSSYHKASGGLNNGFYIKAASVGGKTINFKVYIQQCFKPDGDYTNIVDNPLLISITDANPKYIGCNMPYMSYLRLAFVAEPSNGDDVTVDALICRD